MTILLGHFTNNILPVLISAAIGFILKRTLDIEPRPLSKVVFYVFSPALIFVLLVESEIEATDIARMAGLATLVIILVALASWAFARIARLKRPAMSAFILSATFMNAGNYGLPLNHFAFGEAGLAWAGMFFITSSLLTNSLGVYIATVGQRPPLEALKGLLKVPVIYAIPLGLAVRASGWDIPLSLWRPAQLMADAAVPTMLLLLGILIANYRLPEKLGTLSAAAGLRLLLSPLLALALAPLIGLDGVARGAAIVESAMPTAVFTTVLALEFGVEPELVTGAVLATTLLSPLTVTPLLALLGG